MTAGGETQTVIPKTDTEIDQIAKSVTSLGSRYRWVYYTPVTISGNTATIKLHDGVLSYDTAYYVTVDSSVFSGTYAGSAFAGIPAGNWSFTTKSAPSSYTSVTVDDDGTADFRSVQGALNWIMDKCSSGASSTYACNSSSTAKTITIKNGTYNELLFLRNVSNLTIAGESRAGAVVQYENFEHYNPGSGGSAATASTTLSTEGSGTRRALGGGRPVFLIEGGDLIKLTNFTLQNTHVKSSSFNNQAETIYFNSTSTSGARMTASYMNFVSTQDTLQLKGWVWMYQSLIAGDVDFIWGYPYAAMFENCEIRTVADTMTPSSGGYVVQSRAYAGYPGFVFLNSQLTSASGLPTGATYLARSGGNACSTYNCDDVAYINTKMGTHIATTGWYTTPAPSPSTPTTSTGWRESGSMDANGGTLDVSARNTTYASSALDLSSLNSNTKVFSTWNGTGWTPTP